MQTSTLRAEDVTILRLKDVETMLKSVIRLTIVPTDRLIGMHWPECSTPHSWIATVSSSRPSSIAKKSTSLRHQSVSSVWNPLVLGSVFARCLHADIFCTMTVL